MNHKRNMEDMQQPDLESLAFEKTADASEKNAQAADASGENTEATDASGENTEATDANGEKTEATDASGENTEAADASGENTEATDANGEKTEAADTGTDHEGGDGMDLDQNTDKRKMKETEAETRTADWMKRFESMPYEEAVVLLEKIVSKLESSELSLDESVTLFQQGMHLARICAGRLNEIEGKITKLIETEQEKMEEVPFDLD